MILARISMPLLAMAVLLGGAGALVSGALQPSEARASVSIAVAYDALVKDADSVDVATPMETNSVWEDGRIYTYTRLKVDQSIAGELAKGSEGWVRTMGGVVGKIGQRVDGEPVFITGKASLLFLRKFKAGTTWEVSARAQGQYPIVSDESGKILKVARSAAIGMLLPPKTATPTPTPNEQLGPVVQPNAGITTKSLSADPATVRLAGEALHDRALDDVSKDIAASWKRLHTTGAQSVGPSR